MTRLEKARLFCPDSSSLDFQFMFNPDKVQFKEAVKVGESESARTASGRPKVSFEYPKARTLRLKKIMFDTYESGEDIMAVCIDPLRQSMQFKGFSTGDSYLPRPPIYKFIWGDKDYITCFVEKLDYKLTMFLANGTPVRAEVNLSLKEIDDSFLSSQTRSYDSALFGDRDTRTQPPEAVSCKEANQYHLQNLKDKCENGKQQAEQKREEAKNHFDPDKKVILYEDKHKGGDKKEFGEGEFDQGEMNDLDDDVSSLEVPAGYILDIYEDPGFENHMRTFYGPVYIANLDDYDDAHDTDIDDNIDSLRVRVDQGRKATYDRLMSEADALESESKTACDEYEERKDWYY